MFSFPSRRRIAAGILVPIAAGLLIPATSLASRASIDARSLVRLDLGTSTRPVDVVFGPDGPCALIATKAKGKADTMVLACGRALKARTRLDVVPGRAERPVALDVRDGRIDVVGSTGIGDSNADRPLLVRLRADRSLDTSFGEGGIARLDSLRPDGIDDVLLADVVALPDGGAMASGSAFVDSRPARYVPFVIRVTAAGELDPAFGDSGVRILAVPGKPATAINALRVLDDGTALAVGVTSKDLARGYAPFAALLDASGALITSFGGDGIATPTFGSGATTFMDLPRSNAPSLPIAVSASRNVGGKVRPFLVKLRADGTTQPGWGGAASQSVVTAYGGPTMSQRMSIDVASDGSIYGAAEAYVDGDYDTFVARFDPATGRPDKAFGFNGLEPIDTVPGRYDDEWTSGLAVDPRGVPFVVGAHDRSGGYELHAFSTIPDAAKARVRYGTTLITNAKGDVLDCGASARKPCVVKRGTKLRAAVVFGGWDSTGSALYRPVVHVWSKPPKGDWSTREVTTTAHRYRQQTVAFAPLNLPVGRHQVSANRNGNASWSWETTAYAYVTVR